MRALTKLVISIILVLHVIVWYIICCSFIGAYTGDSSVIATSISFSLLFSFISLFSYLGVQFLSPAWRGIFSHFEEDEMIKTWLFLHSLFTFAIKWVYIPLISTLALIIPGFLNATPEIFSSILIVVSITSLLSICGLWCLHFIIGMGYNWSIKGTSLSIRAFSSLAIYYFENKNEKGMAFLLKSLYLLRDYLRDRMFKIRELDTTIKTLNCLLAFPSRIPYNKLKRLAEVINRYPSVEDLPDTLSNFNKSQEVKWTQNFVADSFGLGKELFR